MMKYLLKIIGQFIGVLLLPFFTFSQITISGPTCILPGMPVQYTISGNWDSATTMKVCLNGGRINDSSFVNGCTGTGGPLAAIIVVWNDQPDLSISLSSTKGNALLQVNHTYSLSGGFINDSLKQQSINAGNIPSIISCTKSNGGSCSPNYSYQWQQSFDGMNWKDIVAATTENLNFDSTIVQSTFYRRKVLENNSGSIAYSDMATVNIIPKSTN